MLHPSDSILQANSNISLKFTNPSFFDEKIFYSRSSIYPIKYPWAILCVQLFLFIKFFLKAFFSLILSKNSSKPPKSFVNLLWFQGTGILILLWFFTNLRIIVKSFKTKLQISSIPIQYYLHIIKVLSDIIYRSWLK